MGTTAEKLTYLNTTKQKIKDAINNIGGSITSETPFRQYVAALESIYQSMPKVSGSGTSLSLSPTLKGLMQSTLKGNTSQVQLSGKNLFDKNTNVLNASINATSYVLESNDNFRTIYFKCSPNTTYTIQKVLSNRFHIGYTSENNLTLPKTLTDVSVHYGDTTLTFTTNNDTQYVFVMISKVSDETTPIQDILDSIQIEVGNQATSYEQYCGGTSSPNPSYPQDIHNVSGNNSIVVCGKNLLNIHDFIAGRLDDGVIGYQSDASIDSCTDNSITFTTTKNYRGITTEHYIAVKPNTNYTFSNSSNLDVGVIARYDKSFNFIGQNAIRPFNSTITTGSNEYYIRIYCYKDNSGTYTINDLMLEEGSTATTYEAYNGTTYPINLPNGMELCKIGDYKDYFYKDSDKWYLHKEINKVVLDGSDETTVSNTGTSNWYYNITKQTGINADSTASANNARCTHYLPALVSNSNTIQGIMLLVAGTIRIRYGTEDTATNFKTWLSNNNVSVYYVLATATNTEITDSTLLSQLEAIYNANSRNGTTNINQENNDLPFILDVSCLKGE